MGKAGIVGGMVLRRFDSVLLGLTLFVALVAVLQPGVYGIGSSEARQRISDGETALTNAFKKVADAETAGANVSALTGRLNEAAGRLGLANSAYADGDFDEALSRASECVNLANGVASDAVELKGQATTAAGGQWMIVVFSVVGAVVFSFVLYGVWVWFRRFYSRKVLGLRPEVEG